MIDFSKIEFSEVRDDAGNFIGMKASLLLNAEIQMPGYSQVTRTGESIKSLISEAKKYCLHSIFSNLYGDIQTLIIGEFKKLINAAKHDNSVVEFVIESREKMIDAVSLDKAMESCQQNSNAALNT